MARWPCIERGVAFARHRGIANSETGVLRSQYGMMELFYGSEFGLLCLAEADVFLELVWGYFFCIEDCHFLSLDFMCEVLGAIARFLSASVERHIQIYFGHRSDHASTLLHCSDFVRY